VRIEPHEFIEVGDHVVVPWTTQAKGRDGIELTARPTVVWTIRNRAIERVSLYQEREDALEVVGVASQKVPREDLVKRAISAVNERNVDAYLACCTEDIELYTPLSHFTGPYEGLTGIRRFFRDMEDTSPDFRLKLERLELVGDQALAFLRADARGRISGVPLDLETANVYDFERDRIKRIRIFSERREALELLGLPE
jgi:ketosteroid isomerase-like protein